MAPTSTRTGIRGGSRGGRGAGQGSGRGGNTVKEMEKKIRKLEKELADYKFHYDALEKDANGVIRNWEVDFHQEVANKKAALKKVKDLRKQVKKMEDEKKIMEKEMKKMREKVKELEVQVGLDRHRITDLVEENRNLEKLSKEKEKAAQEQQCQKISELDGRSTQLEEEKEKSIRKGTQEIDDLKLKYENLENEKNSQIQQNNLLQTQIAGVSARNAELERERENLKDQNSAQAKRIEDLTMEFTQLHQSNGNLNDKLEESGEKIKILEKQHSVLIAKNGVLIREQEEAKRWWKQKLDELNERAEAIASTTQSSSQIVQEDREFAHIRLLGQGSGYTMEAIHRLQHITEIVDSLHSVPQAPQNYNANHIVNISSRIPAERRVNLEFLVYMENRRRQQLGWWQRTRIAVEYALNLIDPIVAPTPNPAHAAPRQK